MAALDAYNGPQEAWICNLAGGSRGIGKGVARQLVFEGATCAICSRHQADIERAAAELTAETGSLCLPFVADMIDPASIEGLVEQSVESLGGIDILEVRP